MRHTLLILTAAIAALSAETASACPYCSQGIRKQVMAGVFDEQFFQNLCYTAAPFLIFTALAVAIHFSGPQRVEQPSSSRLKDETVKPTDSV